MIGKIIDFLRGSGLKPFPIRQTLRHYSFRKARADFKAAVNVALLDFPQGMAYALIAGLPVQVGIYCSALASVTGPMLASSRFVMLGPTNATAVMLLSAFLTLGYNTAQAVAALPVLLILVGVFMTAGSFLRVAGVTQYISRTVVTGYISVAAILIIVNQLKTVLGLHVPRAGTVAQSIQRLVEGIGEAQWEAVATAGLTLAVYYPLKRWARGLPTIALTLLIVGAAVALLRPYGLTPEMLAPISASSWPLTLPSVNLADLADLANAALAIAFLSLLESSSIAKTLAAKAGDRIDLNQQMLSMGAANFACAFGGGMAVSGSLTRSVLNFNSGARTAIASVFSGGLLVLGLFALGHLVGYIPKPALAMLVITVGISLIHPDQIRVMLKTTRSDATVFLATFIGGLVFPLDTAIYLGAATSVALFLRKASKPGLREISFDAKGNLVEHAYSTEKEQRPEVAIVHVEGDLFFASSELFLEQMRHLVEHPALRIILLRLRNAHHLDATVALTIGDLVDFARANERDVIVCGAHPEVEKVFRNSGLLEKLTEANFYRYHPENPTLSTRDALKRAQEITGVESADITIYAADHSTPDERSEKRD